MSEYKETVTTTQDEGTDSTGKEVQQRTKRVATDRSVDGKSTATNLVWLIVGLIEIALAFRFAFKLLGANPSSGFVDFVYGMTNMLTAPFDNIFGVASTTAGSIQAVFEPSILVAAAVYALIGWGITKLLNVDRAA